jgi:hypothetical protein
MDPLISTSLARSFDSIDCIAVKQQIEYFEAMTGIETENSYQVMAAGAGRPAFGPLLAKESSGFLARMCCGNRRPWTIRVGGPDQPVLVVKRPWRWFLQEVDVRSSDGEPLGTVKRMGRGFPFQRNFMVCDTHGEPLLQITCPFLSLGWNFTIVDMDGREIGSIAKKLDFSGKGLAQELFTDADNFGVQFPDRLTAVAKALLLGAVFLIDFCFFEDNEVQHQRKRRGGSRSGW